LYPIDTIKTRLQAMIGGGGWKALVKSGGGKGLYAGVWGNLAGVAPSSALFMAVYEPVKQWMYARTSEDQQFWGPVVAGGWRVGLDVMRAQDGLLRLSQGRGHHMSSSSSISRNFSCCTRQPAGWRNMVATRMAALPLLLPLLHQSHWYVL
jgi:hypothetical protein